MAKQNTKPNPTPEETREYTVIKEGYFHLGEPQQIDNTVTLAVSQAQPLIDAGFIQ